MIQPQRVTDHRGADDLLDQRGIVYQANPAAVAMLGEPLLAQAWFTIISRCFQPRDDDGLEVSLKDGRRVKLQISPILTQSAYTVPGQLIMLTDLTETRQLQSRLSHMQRLSTLGKMMASLAHQIRTPLSAAMLYAQNLGNPRATLQVQQQFQQKLLSRLQDLEQQLNDIWTANLDYSHSDQDSVGSFAAPDRFTQDTRTCSPRSAKKNSIALKIC